MGILGVERLSTYDCKRQTSPSGSFSHFQFFPLRTACSNVLSPDSLIPTSCDTANTPCAPAPAPASASALRCRLPSGRSPVEPPVSSFHGLTVWFRLHPPSYESTSIIVITRTAKHLTRVPVQVSRFPDMTRSLGHVQST